MELFKFKKKANKGAKPKTDSVLANPKILEVNLIQDQEGQVLNWRKFLMPTFLAIITTLILIGEAYLLLSWWQNQESQRLSVINHELEIITKNINGLNQEYQELTAFQQKLNAMNYVVDKQPQWSNFFNWLERKTLSSVTWGGFNGDLSGQYSLSASADTYADISWQVRAFLSDELVKSVRVESGSGGISSADEPFSSNVSFNLQLEIDPELFYKK